jgi:hypothetical protein
MEKIGWTVHVRHEELLHRVKEEMREHLIYNKKKEG